MPGRADPARLRRLRECCRSAVEFAAPGEWLVAAAGLGQHEIAWRGQVVERRECRERWFNLKFPIQQIHANPIRSTSMSVAAFACAECCLA